MAVDYGMGMQAQVFQAQMQMQMQQMRQLQMRNQLMAQATGPYDFDNGNWASQGNSGGFPGSSNASWRGNAYGDMNWQAPPTRSYSIDGNRNGRYDRGRDPVLVFDANRDGRYDEKDVQNTSSMMKAASGNFDLNSDGFIDAGEMMQASALNARYQQMDLDRDGVLNTAEISQGGGKVWVDHSTGGMISNDELYSAYSMPNAKGYGRSQRLDFVSPHAGVSGVSNNWSWNAQPSPFSACGGNGYPGSNYGGSYRGNYGGSYGGYYGG